MRTNEIDRYKTSTVWYRVSEADEEEGRGRVVIKWIGL